MQAVATSIVSSLLKTPLSLSTLIILSPRKHDGSDDADNLCLACFDCNMYKSHDLTEFDPDTGEITPLFNPRQQDWKNKAKSLN